MTEKKHPSESFPVAKKLNKETGSTAQLNMRIEKIDASNITAR